MKDFILGFVSVFHGLLPEISNDKQQSTRLHYFEQVEQDFNNAFEQLKQQYERN